MNNKGVTIITLIVTILVILILSSIFVSVGLDSLKEAKESESLKVEEKNWEKFF